MSDSNTFLTSPARSTSLALTGPVVSAQSPIAGDGTAPPSSSGGYRFWRAVHRRGVLAFLLAVPIAAASGAAMWYFKPDTYTSTALLRIAANDRTILFETADERQNEAFIDYKRTQRQLIRSPDVLMQALRDEKVAALPVIQNAADPLTWLEKKLDVSFPDDAQVMKVTLSASPPEGLDQLVNQVVNSYLKEFVHKEYEQKAVRLNSLMLTHSRFEENLRKRRSEFQQYQERLGEDSPERLSFQQQTALQQYSGLQQQLLKVQMDILEGDLEGATAG